MQNNTVIVGNFNTPLLVTGKKYRQKVNKKSEDLDNSIDQWT